MILTICWEQSQPLIVGGTQAPWKESAVSRGVRSQREAAYPSGGMQISGSLGSQDPLIHDEPHDCMSALPMSFVQSAFNPRLICPCPRACIHVFSITKFSPGSEKVKAI